MRIGFIGCGNMASAMIQGILENRKDCGDELMASARSEETRRRIREKLRIREGSNAETAAFEDLLFIAVKPYMYEEVLAEVSEAASEDTIIVSIAPGKTLEWLEDRLGGERKIVRAMPNTPAMVGEGMTGICWNRNVLPGEADLVVSVCSCFGQAESVPEGLMDVVTAVSGSSPA